MSKDVSKDRIYSDRHNRRLARNQTMADIDELRASILQDRNIHSDSESETDVTNDLVDDQSLQKLHEIRESILRNRKILSNRYTGSYPSTSRDINSRNDSLRNDSEMSFHVDCNDSIGEESSHDFNVKTMNDICNEEDLLRDEIMYQYSDSELSDLEPEGQSDIDNEQILDEDHEIVENNDDELFKSDIRQWAVDYSIHHNALSALLHILNTRTVTKFPTDARTLMKTPRCTKLISISGGHYCHFGLKEAIERIICKRVTLGMNTNKVHLFVSTDGAPIGKSSSSGMWPILCSDVILQTVEMIGIFLGDGKPEDSNEFMRMFVDEAVCLVNNDFLHNGILYEIRIIGLICDSPAKSFIIKTKYHSGYSSCTKCTIHGDSINYTICFPNEQNNPVSRTDEEFQNFRYMDDYQKGQTILTKIPHFGLVTNVPLDYMHLVCLGVVRKLLLLWMQGPLKFRLSTAQINKISEALIKSRKYLPSDFPRKPRSLKFIKIWKATEFRTFLLYLGPVILKNILHERAYEHFLLLHVSITILASPNYVSNPESISYANELLEIFVVDFAKLYGPKYISYNVHNLRHLASDVRYYGPVDKFSAFKFESFLCSIKNLIRKGDKPLQQIARRLVECNFVTNRTSTRSIHHAKLEKSHHGGPILEDRAYVSQYKVLRVNTIYINSESETNDTLLLKNGTFIAVLNFAKAQDNCNYIIGQKFTPQGSLYTLPCNSNDLNIVTAHKSNRVQSWPCEEICAKVCKIPNGDGVIILPILHTDTEKKNFSPNMSTYTVVEFVDGVLAVPTTWIDLAEMSCKWPPLGSEPHKAIQNMYQVEDDWGTLPIEKIFGKSCPDYKSAKEKEKLVQVISDCDNEEVLKKSRHSRNRIILSSGSDSNEEIVPPKKKRFANKSVKQSCTTSKKLFDDISTRVYPKPPTVLSQQANQLDDTVSTRTKSVSQDGNSLVTETLNSQENIEEPREKKKDSHDNHNDDTTGDMIGQTSLVNEKSHRKKDTHAYKFFTTDEKLDYLIGLQEAHFTKINKIHAEVTNLQKTLKSNPVIENKDKNAGIFNESSHDNLNNKINRNFPINDEKSLLELDEKLADKKNVQFKKDVIQVLLRRGGNGFEELTNNIMSKILTNSFALNYSYFGRQKKKSFAKHALCQCVISAVCASESGITEKNVERKIGTWLANAPSRLERAKVKSEKTQEIQESSAADDQVDSAKQ